MRDQMASRRSSLVRSAMLLPTLEEGIGELGTGEDVLVLAHAFDELVPAVGHDGAHAEEHDAWSEALGGEVTLGSLFSMSSARYGNVNRTLYWTGSYPPWGGIS